ncbi:MAG TPA: DUF4112 domain-containing protein [Candidatus Kapabacteria bacterium]|nr:DUF4112 domain-containing protein [Candidatus Kapabacteria bacterium]
MENGQTGIYSIQNLQRLANLLDNQFRIPFTRYRIGWDFIIGLIPVAGDVLTGLASLFILIGARKYGVSGRIQLRMLVNILIDVLAGSVPVLGDILDASFKANARNMRLLLDAIESRQNDGNLNNSKR